MRNKKYCSIINSQKKNYCYRKLVAIVLLFISPILLAIDSRQWHIQKIQVEDGLPDSTIFSIQQDKSGFMWFGTTNGIARYNGYTFKTFKHEGTDPNSISNNNAGNIFIDSKNNLWIGTFGGGVNKFNLNTGKLKRFPYSNSKIHEMISENVQTFFEDKSSNIWIGTAAGLYRLQDGKLTHFNHDKDNENSLIHSRVWDIVADEQDNIWIGTTDGLSQFNPKTGEFNNYNLPKELILNVSSNQFRKLILYNDTLWIGSSTGLFSMDLKTKLIKSHSTEIKINDLFLIDDGHFLIASMGGLYYFDLNKEAFSIDQKGEVWQLFDHIDVRNIFLDQSEILWLATRNNGIIKIDQAGGLFQHHKDFIPKNQFSEKSKQVWSMKFDSQQNLYLATSGMLFKRSKENKISTITTKNSNQIPGIIRYITQADNKGMWIAGSDGLFFLEKNGTIAQTINEPFDLVGIKPTDVFSVVETKTGEIWLALYNLGVLRWNPNNSTAELIQSYQSGLMTDLNILDIYQDTDGNIWMASYIAGLLRYNSKSKQIELFDHDYNDDSSISSNRVRDIFQDSNGKLWIATSRGLNLFIPKSNSFKNYMQPDGLLDNSIYSITEDSKQNLWLSYKFGISHFNPTREEMTNYLLNTSIKYDGLTPRAATIDKKDKLYFGSSNGFYTFNPKDIKSSSKYNPLLKLTNVAINNHVIPFEALSSNQNKFELSHKDQVISFDFAALEYKVPEQVKYSYRIDGLQNNWHDVTTSRHIELNNLNPGNYKLEIKANNNDGRWAIQTLKIDIIVHPVWWNQGWIRALIALLAIVIALAFHYYRTYKIKSRNLLLESQVESRTSELLSLNEKLRIASHTDYLTGLYNRMGFLNKVRNKPINSANSCIVLSDVDDFKNINDLHGHSAGDEVLKVITMVMRSFIKKGDFLARWGGEEFIFYFDNKNEEEIKQIIENMRIKIQDTKTTYKNHIISVTCTFGICQLIPGMSLDKCINAADRAMYIGKSKGRNTIIVTNFSGE